MTKIRIPNRWLAMHSGDFIVSKIPFHRIERYALAAESRGYSFSTTPCDAGYIVTCERSPHDNIIQMRRAS